MARQVAFRARAWIVCAAGLGLAFAGTGNLAAEPPTDSAPTERRATSAFPAYKSLALGYTSGYVTTWNNQGRQDLGLPQEVTREYVSQSSDRRIVAVGAGDNFSVALTKAGRVIMWGDDPSKRFWVPPEASSGVKTIVAGASHVFAITAEGRLIGWGNDACGRLNIPESARTDVVAVSSSYCHSLALKKDGSVVAWGTPLSPAAADPAFGPLAPLPVPESARTDATAVYASTYGAYVVKKDGSVISWYPNCRYVYDEETRDHTPRCDYLIQQPRPLGSGMDSWRGYIPLEAASGVREITGSGIHRVAVKQDGTIVQWGHHGARYQDLVWLRKGHSFVSDPKRVGAVLLDDAGLETCIVSLRDTGLFGVGCLSRKFPLVQGTPQAAWDHTIDFDVRRSHVVALMGIADVLPGGFKYVDSQRALASKRHVDCIIFMFSDDPLLGPLAPSSPGSRPVHNLKPGYWLEYRPAGQPNAPWQAVYPWAYLGRDGPNTPVPDVWLYFRCGTVPSRGSPWPEFEIRVVNTLGPGPSKSTVGPPPSWSG